MAEDATAQHAPLRRVLEAITGPWTWRNAIHWIVLIGGILFIKGCVVDQYRIPSDSMVPTLNGDPGYFTGDRVIVNKWVYGPRIPFTTTRLAHWEDPKRWDIVVFKSVEENPTAPILIKRIVGLPGERIRLHRGELYVNDELVPFPSFMPEGMEYWNRSDFVGRLILLQATPEQIAAFDEQMPLKYGCLPEDQYSVVPEGHYLLLGDNTRESRDGRVFGWVPRDHILGRAAAIWWPWERRRDFTGWTDTWWGMALLIVLPTIIVLFEFIQYWRSRQTSE
ncbi:MAG: signal peptidase I [Candidatus Hydrogenedentes bacterium]|nr:signal peptidase I [Candidatus Hydrogenedentota bacterium]